MVDIVVVQDAQVGSGAVCAAAGMGYALLSGISAALMRMVWEGDMKGMEMKHNSVKYEGDTYLHRLYLPSEPSSADYRQKGTTAIGPRGNPESSNAHAGILDEFLR